LEVVGEGDEADLGGYLFKASQAEPSEPLVLFDVPEYRFDLPPCGLFSIPKSLSNGGFIFGS